MMDCIEELCNLMFKNNDYHKKLLAWWDKYKNEPVMETEIGKTLRSHLNEMLVNEAFLWNDMAIITMEQAEALLKQ